MIAAEISDVSILHFHGSMGKYFISVCKNITRCPGSVGLLAGARHIYSPKVLVMPRKRWLRPNMTETFTGAFSGINQPTNHPSIFHQRFYILCDKVTVKDRFLTKILNMLIHFLFSTSSRVLTKPIRSDTNPAVQLQKMTRGLGGRGIFIIKVAKTKTLIRCVEPRS